MKKLKKEGISMKVWSEGLSAKLSGGWWISGSCHPPTYMLIINKDRMKGSCVQGETCLMCGLDHSLLLSAHLTSTQTRRVRKLSPEQDDGMTTTNDLQTSCPTNRTSEKPNLELIDALLYYL